MPVRRYLECCSAYLARLADEVETEAFETAADARRPGHHRRADQSRCAGCSTWAAATGDLLAHLQANKQVNGYGLEIDAGQDRHLRRVRASTSSSRTSTRGLDNFPDDSFDLVVMTETLQSVRSPDGCSTRCCA